MKQNMYWYWIYFLCVLLYVHADLSVPLSPCPHLFHYQLEGHEWVGIAQVDSLTLGKTMKFEVVLSLSALLVKYAYASNPRVNLQYLGTIELYGSRVEEIQRIQFDQSVRYRIRFASQNPLPKLQQLSVNGEVLCTGQPLTGSYVTLIKLEHTLYTEAAAGFPLSGVNNNTQPQDPFITYSSDDNFDYKEYEPRPTVPEKLQQSQTEHSPVLYDSNNQRTADGLQNECGTLHAKNNFRHLVVGGEPVKRGAWPWLVAVYLKGASGLLFNCGGNLISAMTVVTAAHCLRTSKRTYQPNEIVLFLGRNNILERTEAGAKAVQVKEIFIHSDYMSKDTSYDADIAVLIMRRRVKFNEFIRPICLWSDVDSLSSIEGQLGTVVGWGKDGMGNTLTHEPKKITIPVVSEAECLRSSDTYRYITSERTFCAGGRDGTGPCNGDSGGGMSFKRNNRWMLRGIVSAALADPIENTCNLDEFVVFTDVAKFVSWIKSYMR